MLSLPVLRRLDPLVVAGCTMLLGGIAALPLAVTGFPGLSEPLSSVEWGSVSAASWTATAYSTVLCSSFAIAAWQVNVHRLGANRVLVYLYLVTLVGLIASVMLLGEDLGRARSRGRPPSCWASTWLAAPSFEKPTARVGSFRHRRSAHASQT